MQLSSDRILKSLPTDPIQDSRPRTVRGACFSRVIPTPVENPRLVTYEKDVLTMLGLEGLTEDEIVDNFRLYETMLLNFLITYYGSASKQIMDPLGIDLFRRAPVT